MKIFLDDVEIYIDGILVKQAEVFNVPFKATKEDSAAMKNMVEALDKFKLYKCEFIQDSSAVELTFVGTGKEII